MQSNSNIKMVQLKNGATVPECSVKAIMITLRGLISGELGKGMQGPIAFIELIAKCRNPAHKLWGDTGVFLKELALLQSDGTPHESVKDIVLSAAVGEGLETSLANPISMSHIASVEQSRKNAGNFHSK